MPIYILLIASSKFILMRWKLTTDNAARLQPRYILAKWNQDQVLAQENFLPLLSPYLDQAGKKLFTIIFLSVSKTLCHTKGLLNIILKSKFLEKM